MQYCWTDFQQVEVNQNVSQINMIDERLANLNLPMVSTESEIAKNLRYDWVDKTFASWKLEKRDFPSLKYSKF